MTSLLEAERVNKFWWHKCKFGTRWQSLDKRWKKNFNWRKAIILKWLSRLISAWTWWNLGAVKVLGFYCSDFALPPHTLRTGGQLSLPSNHALKIQQLLASRGRKHVPISNMGITSANTSTAEPFICLWSLLLTEHWALWYYDRVVVGRRDQRHARFWWNLDQSMPHWYKKWNLVQKQQILIQKP